MRYAARSASLRRSRRSGGRRRRCSIAIASPRCVEAAEAGGYAHRDIVSGAGHDAAYVNRVAPTAMIFVPCADGISHNEVESATPGDLAAGCNVLLRAMLDRAVAR